MKTDKHLFTVSDIATRLSVSNQTVYRMVQDGRLQEIRIGRMIRILDTDFDKFLSSKK